MDFAKPWTKFAIEAEIEDFGPDRLVTAHNKRVEELERQLADLRDEYRKVDDQNERMKIWFTKRTGLLDALLCDQMAALDKERDALQSQLCAARGALQLIADGEKKSGQTTGPMQTYQMRNVAKAALEAEFQSCPHAERVKELEAQRWECYCGWINGINLAVCAKCNRTPGESMSAALEAK